MVHHLEHGVQYRALVCAGLVNLDTMEGDLCEVAEANLFEDLGNVGYGGQVQAQGRYFFLSSSMLAPNDRLV